jgi:hypothetical protein
MNKIIIALFIATLTTTAFSQECQYEKNEIDKFTKSSIKTTKEMLIAGGSFKLKGTLYASLSKINDLKYLNLKLITWQNFVIETNAKLMILLEDDTVIDLSFLKYGVGDYANNEGMETWTANVSLNINEENYKILTQKNAKEIRIYLKEGYVNLPVPENKKYWSKFKENLKCIE